MWHLSLSSHILKVGGVLCLIDSLIFKKFNNEEIDLKTNKKLIFESSDSGGNVNVSNVTFSIDKGLFLKPSKDLLEGEDYSTKIIWSVEE